MRSIFGFIFFSRNVWGGSKGKAGLGSSEPGAVATIALAFRSQRRWEKKRHSLGGILGALQADVMLVLDLACPSSRQFADWPE